MATSAAIKRVKFSLNSSKNVKQNYKTHYSSKYLMHQVKYLALHHMRFKTGSKDNNGELMLE